MQQSPMIRANISYHRAEFLEVTRYFFGSPFIEERAEVHLSIERLPLPLRKGIMLLHVQQEPYRLNLQRNNAKNS